MGVHEVFKVELDLITRRRDVVGLHNASIGGETVLMEE